MHEESFVGRSVLVVDNDTFIAKILVSVLTAFEFGAVLEAPSFDEAKAILWHQKIDCLMIDCLSGDRVGFDVVDFVRGDPESPNPEMPIILCTARTELANICEARDHGITEVVAKPFSPEQVLKKLLSALYKRREFVAVDSYTGPDRRRKTETWHGDERRGQFGLSQDQIDDMMTEAG